MKSKQMQVFSPRRKFVTLKMSDDEPLQEFPYRILKIVNQKCIIGEKLPDKRIVEKVLIFLPEKFKSKISFVEEKRDIFYGTCKCSQSHRAKNIHEATNKMSC